MCNLLVSISYQKRQSQTSCCNIAIMIILCFFFLLFSFSNQLSNFPLSHHSHSSSWTKSDCVPCRHIVSLCMGDGLIQIHSLTGKCVLILFYIMCVCQTRAAASETCQLTWFMTVCRSSFPILYCIWHGDVMLCVAQSVCRRIELLLEVETLPPGSLFLLWCRRNGRHTQAQRESTSQMPKLSLKVQPQNPVCRILMEV